MMIERIEQYVVREQVMRLLSAEERLSVTDGGRECRLREGQEYLDLEQAMDGVKRATKSSPPAGRVLPRDAVDAATWSEILSLVASPFEPIPR